MSRTLLTSFTTLAVVVLLLLFGGEGMLPPLRRPYGWSGPGYYSSVFVASPALLALNKGRPASALLSQATTYGDDEDEEGVEGVVVGADGVVDTEAVVTSEPAASTEGDEQKS